MQLTWQSNGRLRVINLTAGRTRLAFAAGTCLVLSACLWIGGLMARTSNGLVPHTHLAEAEARHSAALAVIDAQEARLNAISIRLSRMQAHVIRLDALGSRLTKMAGLDPDDFSFSRPPAQGGRDSESWHPRVSATELESGMAGLDQRLRGRDVELRSLADLLLNRQLQEQVRPDGHPVASGYISSFFGRRTDPFTGRRTNHKGVDYAGREGAHVIAVADGVVSESRFYGGFGNFVEINHGRGFFTRYAHNQKNLVRAGDRVTRGQPIALLGSTGRATGPNLHFEVLRDGRVVDPMTFIGSKRP